jgi:fructokinase
MTPYQIGIDLGGTKTEAVLLDPSGGELFRKRQATPRQMPDPDTYAAIVETVSSLIEETAKVVPAGKPYTVGIGIPGILDADTQKIQNANTTSLIGRPFKADLEQRLGRSVAMENDANCFTLAECVNGAGRGRRIVVGVIMGTGCGGGICIDGRIHNGRHGIAGEWGHFSVEPEGAACFCGNRGCVETLISGTGVEHRHTVRCGQTLPMKAITRGFRTGDPECVETFTRFLDDFGRCLGGVVSFLDPDAVVLGGGLSNIDELYTLGRRRMQAYAFHPRATTPILKHQLGDSAGVYGAAWIGV